jgi:hypothetical protein
MKRKILPFIVSLLFLAGCATIFHAFHADTPVVQSVGTDKALSFKVLDEKGTVRGRFSLDHDCEVVVYERGLYDVNVIPGQIDYIKYTRRDGTTGSGTLVLKLKDHFPLTVCAITDSDWKQIIDFTKDWVGFGVFISE